MHYVDDDEHHSGFRVYASQYRSVASMMFVDMHAKEGCIRWRTSLSSVVNASSRLHLLPGTLFGKIYTMRATSMPNRRLVNTRAIASSISAWRDMYKVRCGQAI